MSSIDIAAPSVHGMFAAFAALGLDVSRLAREVELDPSRMEPDVRVADDVVVRLWTRAEKLYDSPLLGVDAGGRVPFAASGLLDYVLAGNRSAGEAITRLARYVRLCSPRIGYSIEAKESGFVVTFEQPRSVEHWPTALVEYLWSLVMTQLARRFGPSFAPILRFRHAAPGASEAYRSLPGTVEHQCSETALVIAQADWSRESADADPQLTRLIEQYERDVLGLLSDDDDPLAILRNELTKALRKGGPGLEGMAQALAMTPRTVQRRLAERGYSFKGLLDEVRAKLATTYLLESKLAIVEVAYLLGYSEPSAFNRAFRRWTRSSPAAFRAGHRPSRDHRYASSVEPLRS